MWENARLVGSALSNKHDEAGLYWVVPVVTVGILIGLAMDYELFLFARIYEYRSIKGYDHRSAIVLGVANTGPIISSAGIVMSMAFLGLLFQDMIGIEQIGFIWTFGVLVDTFIIRPLLVPSMISCLDWVNWWPLKMPKDHLKTIFFDREPTN